MSFSDSPSSDSRDQVDLIGANDSFGIIVVQLLAFSVIFVLAYKLSTARLWLPDSVLLVALLFTPRKRWWIFLILPLVVRYYVGPGTTLTLGIFFTNYVNDILKALIGASLLRWLNNGPPKLTTILELFEFFAVAVVLTPALSAFVGAATRVSLGAHEYWVAWQIWFLGDALANLILTPFLVYLIVEGIPAIKGADRWRVLEAIVLYGALIVIGLIGLIEDESGLGYAPLLANLTLPLLMYAAVRFGPLGVSSGVVVSTAFLVWNARVLGNGPLATQSPAEILWIQMVFYTVSIPLLCVAVLLRQSNENERLAVDNQKQARDLAGRLIYLQDDERRRIAHALHDTLGQSLSVIKIVADTGVATVFNRPEVAKQFTEIATVAASAHQEVREIVHNLRPAGLDHFGLVTAVKSVIRRLTESTSIKLTADLDPIDGLLTKDEETSVYRIIQESLNNVIAHSDATEASVTFRRQPDGLMIVVEDNGKGLDEDWESHTTGFGLSGIAERVRLINGELNIESSAGQGTKLQIYIYR